MRLGGRITIAFAVAASLPIAGGAYVAHREVAARYEREFDRALTQEESRARQAFDSLAAETATTGARLAASLVPLSAVPGIARGDLDEDEQRQLMAKVSDELRGHGLDALTLYDAKGVRLACGHFVGRVGDRDPGYAYDEKRRADVHLATEQILAPGKGAPSEELLLAAVVPIELQVGEHRAKMTLLAGRRLEAALTPRLGLPARVTGIGTRVAPEGVTRSLMLGAVEGKPIGLEIWMSRDELEREQSRVRKGAAGLSAAAIALAIVFGAWTARRIARPLQALTEQVHALAAGRPVDLVAAGTNDEVGELSTAFNQMTRDLDAARASLQRAERIAAWREVAQRIAHEVKNPLSPIQMAIETLQRVRRGEGRCKVEFLELFDGSAVTILSEVARLQHIIGEFSRFARMPAPSRTEVDLQEVVDHVLALYASLPRAIVRDRAPMEIRISADRDQLTQVLVNLLENAKDAIEPIGERGEIYVATGVDGGVAHIRVRDNGGGMTDEVRARVFTPYYTTKPKGSGLGLAIVFAIVTDHDGTVEIDSAPGTGTRNHRPHPHGLKSIVDLSVSEANRK